MASRITPEQRLAPAALAALDSMGDEQPHEPFQPPPAPRRPLKMASHWRWLAHRMTTDTTTSPQRPLLPSQHHNRGRKAWLTTDPLRVPSSKQPFLPPFGWSSAFPLHLDWLGNALEWGCLGHVACLFCRRPLNLALRPVGWSEWHGTEAEWCDPENGTYPTKHPPGGYAALPGPWPPHGNACISANRGEAALAPQDNAWWVALRTLKCQQLAGDSRPIWDGDRLRTELLPNSQLTLTND